MSLAGRRTLLGIGVVEEVGSFAGRPLVRVRTPRTDGYPADLLTIDGLEAPVGARVAVYERHPLDRGRGFIPYAGSYVGEVVTA